MKANKEPGYLESDSSLKIELMIDDEWVPKIDFLNKEIERRIPNGMSRWWTADSYGVGEQSDKIRSDLAIHSITISDKFFPSISLLDIPFSRDSCSSDCAVCSHRDICLSNNNPTVHFDFTERQAHEGLISSDS